MWIILFKVWIILYYKAFYLIFLYFEIKLYFLILVYISKIKTPYNQVSQSAYFYIIKNINTHVIKYLE
ncbi:hypothetical protein D5F87_09235 [Streptococcus agalactiae]|nr:hypothetical protein D5F87_09235 [Streptococcus agalactiae]